jgi:hypothetical protein
LKLQEDLSTIIAAIIHDVSSNLLLCAGMLYVGRSAALTLLAIATTLTINVVNNLQFVKRSPVAISVYGKTDITVTFAGGCLNHCSLLESWLPVSYSGTKK